MSLVEGVNAVTVDVLKVSAFTEKLYWILLQPFKALSGAAGRISPTTAMQQAEGTFSCISAVVRCSVIQVEPLMEEDLHAGAGLWWCWLRPDSLSLLL